MAALVTHEAPEPLRDRLAEAVLGLGDGLVVLGRGDGLVVLGLGEPGLGDSQRGDGDAEVALGLGDSLGERACLGFTGARADGTLPDACAALWMIGPQPVSTTMVADTAIAGHIRFVFTSDPPTCQKPNVGHQADPTS